VITFFELTGKHVLAATLFNSCPSLKDGNAEYAAQ
jgi:hypothetical protein